MKVIAELSSQLIAAQRLTMQSSHDRRAPSPKSIPPLLAVKYELGQFLAENPDSAEAHRLLSMAQECLLNYPGARASFETALRISGQKDNKDLKHLALLREYEGKWNELPVTPDELANLGRFLEHALAKTPCDHSLEHTRLWLAEHSPGRVDSKLKTIRHRGGYCDCEVLCNVV